MKLTKKLEAEILETYYEVFDANLRGDMRTFASILDENCHIFGTAASEVFKNKKAAVKFYTATAGQVTGKVELRNRNISVMAIDNDVMVNEQADFYILIDDQWTFYNPCRVSCLFHKKNNQWKTIHMHGSFPDSKTEEGEQVNTDKIKAENIQLRDAVKRRTAELENKNRELEIETSLEKVRTVAMGMRKPENFPDVCEVLFKELQSLGFNELRNAMVNIHNDEKRSFVNYDYSDEIGKSITPLVYDEHPVIKKQIKQIRKADDAFSESVFKGKDLEDWKTFRKSRGEKNDKRIRNIKELYYYFYSIGTGSIGISTFDKINEEKKDVLKRFRNVFAFAYRRYIDVAQAEAQAKEAQIEAALERVRSRTNAMHRSENLHDVINEVNDQLRQLGFRFDGTDFLTNFSDKGYNIWLANFPTPIYVPAIDHKLVHLLKKAIKRGDDFLAFTLTTVEKNIYFKNIFENTIAKNFSEELKQYVFNAKGMATSCVVLENIILSVTNFAAIPFTDTENEILKRFAKVFEQSYTRFLDLQKAEAQAKEARIELALERVRARAMAMHNSSELAELVSTVFSELTQLDFRLTSCIIWIHDHVHTKNTLWIASAEMNKPAEPFLVNVFHNDFFRSINHAWKSKDTKWVYTFTGKEKKNFEKAFFKELPQLPISLKNALKVPEQVVFSASFNNFGALEIVETEALTDEKFEILHRFGKVFDSSYTRFNDLKKAEAQAREAQIEASLEKVRGRAMAMHKSEELLEAGALLYNELSKLGIEKLTSGYMLIDEDEKMGWNYGVNPSNGQIIPKPVGVPLTEKKEIRSIIEAWKSQEPIHVKHLDPQETIIHQSYMADHAINFPISKKKLLSITPERLVIHTFNFKQGYLIIVRGEELAAEQQEMVVRFAKVFEMTYRRFLDLQKAEAQAREAQIETGLERVRSKTMAMHKSEEVTGIAVSLNEELMKLSFQGGSTIIIINKETGDTEQWSGFSEDKTLKSCNVPYFKHPCHDAILHAWKKGEKFLVYDLTGKEKKAFDEHYFATGYKDFPESDKKWMREMGSVTFSYAFMKYGAIHWGPGFLTEEQLKILQRFSKVFEQSYTRFLDLQKAETQVREAKIEAALERTRTQSMLMQHSKELDDTLRVFHEQVLLLGINSEFSYLWLPDEDKDRHIFWAAWAENLPTSQRGKNSSKVFKSKALNYPLDRNEPATKKCLVDWKSDEPVHSYYLPPVEVENYFVNWKELLDGVERLNPKYFPGGLNYVEAFMKYGCFGVMIENELSEEEKKILYRFAIEFERTYTRFLDLQKAESQAREAQIEAALERVRSRSMAMHKSDDLHEVIKVVTEQLSVLDLKFNVANFAKIDPDGSWDIWLSTPDQTYPALIHVPYLNHPLFNEIIELIVTNKDFYTGVYTREEANIFFHHFFENTIAKNTPEERKQFLYRSEGFARSIFLTKNIWFSVARYDATPFIDEENAIFKRFANVFEQAYTRFLDLQKAEAQARETEIELSLERVRAKTMAMQKPSEFGDVINIIGAQFVHLGFDIDWVNFGASGFAISEGIDIWNFAVIPGASPISARVFIPYFDHPVFTTSAATINEFTNGGKDFVTVTLDKQTKDKWLDHLFTKTIFKDVPEEYRVIQYAKSGYTTSNISLKDTWLSIGKFDIKNFTDEQHAIFRRFANAFGQAYTRFLDLQKAEAQAREAQIEASLERVRSRAMAMQNSDELKELIGTVFTELTKLDIVLTRCLIMIYDPRSNDSIWWMANSEAPTEPIGLRIQNHEHPPYVAYLKAWQEKKLNWVYVLEGAVKKDWDDFLFVETELSHLPDFVIAGMKAPERVYLNSSFNSFGNLTLATLEPLSNEHFDILLRFAKVFDLTYTRFNDLKQAEAQAKESRIQLALERVRARTMAMQKSDELAEAARLLYDEFNTLGINTFLCGYCFYKEEQNKQTVWVSAPDGTLIPDFTDFPLGGDHVLNKRYEDWKQKKPLHVLEIKGEENKEHHRFLSTVVPKKIAQEIFAQIPDRIIFYCANFSAGYLFIIATEFLTREEEEVIIRFAKVFESTYTRFLDLQKAEAQAKEARIEAALERVRSRSMAMHSPEELKDVALELRNQLGILEQPELEVCAIHLYEESPDYFEAWAAVRPPGDEGKIIQVKAQFPKKGIKIVDEMFLQYEAGTQDYVLINEGEKVPEWLNVLKQHIPEGYKMVLQSFQGRRPEDTRAYWSMADFKGGSLIMTTYISPTDDARRLLRRFANVFGLAYRRFIDLKNAEIQKREAQIELALERVRARTMAMHKSEELAETAQVLFQQLSELGGIPDRISIGIADEANGVVNFWTTDQQGSRLNHSFSARLNERTTIAKTYQAWKEQKRSLVVDLHGDELKEWILFAREEMGIAVKDDQIKDRRVHTLAFFSHGWILVSSHEPQLPDTIQILERFASVFNLTYRRFLDLEKAEAQAREAQIETVLERVRSRTMAMQKSDELTDVAGLLFEQVSALGIKTWTAGFNVWSEDNNSYVDYITSPQGGFIEPYTVYTDTAEALTDISNARKSGVEFDVQYVEGEKIKQLYLALTKLDEKQYEIMLQDGVRFPSHQYEHFVFGSKVSLMFITYEPVPEAHDIFKRLGKVFEQTYTRFLDLQKAEAQARESQIEGALEKIRSHTMGMRSSEDLANVASVMFDQMRILGGDLFSFGIVLCDKHENMVEQWHGIPGAGMLAPFFVPVNLDHIHQYRYDQWKTGTELFSIVIPEDYIAHHFELMLALPSVKAEWEAIAAQGIALPPIPTWEIDYGASFRYGYLLVSALKPFEEDKIFPRFAKVFEQAYTRFLDLQKAEAQARESQIEASLERVRSKTMAMHNSQDVGNTVATMFDQLVHLGIKTNRCGILIFSDTNKSEVWTAKSSQSGEATLIIGHLDITIHPMLQGVHHAWKNNESFYNYELAGDDIKNYYNAINNYPDYPTRFNLDNLPSREIHSDFFFPEGAVFSFTSEPVPEGDALIFKRFAGVFGQTYRRYLDLQKAEANAREAQIEAGLERVRARTMAMHSSEDVSIATATMFTELEKLGIENFRGGITNIIPNRTQHVWSVNNLEEGKVLKSVGTFNIDAHPFWQLMYKEWEAKKDFIHYYLAGEDKQDYFEVLNAIQGYLPQNFQQYPDLHFQVYYFNEGAVWTNSLQPHSEEDKQVMKRFTSVFSLTYRRYQDLKKAEAQAKEATIEAALERVRGKAMAMHNSNDLSVTTSMIITELGKLGIKPIRCGVGIINKETHKGQLYTARFSPDGDSLSVVGWVLLEGHPVLENIYEKWVEGEDYFPELSGDSRKAYYEQLLAGLSVPIPDFKDEQIHYGHFFSFSVGCLYAWSEVKYNDDEIKILKRFASIIDLTFRRYFELQKSETNAREAVKQAALDRVRAEIASMRTINDLDRITPLIWNELTVLGIPFIRCGVFIMDEEQELIHTFLSTPDGKAIAAFHLPYDTPGNLNHVLINWKENRKYIDRWDESEFKQFADILVEQGTLASADQYLKTIPHGGFYLHFLPFLQGMLYVGNTDQLKEEEIELIQHVADAFSTAYARYEDFNKLESAKQQVENTLTDLKQAQTQLVQSEKMASLGELTAGIAHEIQNPLNFVNNFSDVSSELLEEMKVELEKGNKEDAIAIVEDVKQNLEKILHHGRRADAIVKGMLQHSRTSSGQKEPTDINNLADEYLRLSFHGLRAKDKSFNARFETKFDNSIEKINIIPQDIGRVILNLINNAFYAVTEKKKVNTNGYEPVVTVTTKKDSSKIEIKVKDNGNGIPQKVLDKIFQPFFTTKPTGQGTGLGLSLAYDIITKGHGGELKVETKEGEGSEFIIQLPNQT